MGAVAEIVVIGTGSQARYVLETLCADETVKVLGLADVEDWTAVGKRVNGVPVVCHIDDLVKTFDPGEVSLIVAYGDNQKKRQIVEELARMGYRWARAVSRQAYVSPSAAVGIGSIINPLVALLPGAKIEEHVVVHSQAVIEHDFAVVSFANVGPGVKLAGRVTVGEGAYIYTGAVIIPGRRVGRGAVVGAGAVVIRDVPDFDVVAGVPALSIRKDAKL